MDYSAEKKALRSMLLNRRDETSFDFLKIASGKIRQRISEMKEFRNAKRIGAYHPIGSEIMTQDMIQEAISLGKEVFLPRVSGETIEFRKIAGFTSLEKSDLGIMEPKDDCIKGDHMDVIFVPTVGISPLGVRLGYGRGFYDRFLAKCDTLTVSPSLEKQIIKNIPRSDHDVLIDRIITEERIIYAKE